MVSNIHDRMPVILDRQSEKTWLQQANSVEEHMSLLKSYDEHKMESYSVSSQVNSVENDNPKLILSAPRSDQFGNFTLFD